MARPREFEIEQVVAAAMAVFWQNGYRDASLPDLLSGMGITRGSLYKAFGDKRRLFLEALRLYGETVVAPAEAALKDSSRPGRERIAEVFEHVLTMVEAGDRRGCLLCVAVAGPAAEDAEIAATVENMLGRLRAGLLAACGDESRAATLLVQYIGLGMLVRSGLSPETLRASVDGLLAMPLSSRAAYA